MVTRLEVAITEKADETGNPGQQLKSADVRELASEEIDAVAGGMINNPLNFVGQMLVDRTEAWLASVGVDVITGG